VATPALKARVDAAIVQTIWIRHDMAIDGFIGSQLPWTHARWLKAGG
jgi:hypothetical protein